VLHIVMIAQTSGDGNEAAARFKSALWFLIQVWARQQRLSPNPCAP
jgi:hypothetical protein